MPRRPAPLAAAALLAPALLALTGCARDANAGDHPSLARRPVERLGFAEPVLPPAPPEVADPQRDARLAAMRTRLATVAAGFTSDAAAASRAGATARRAAVGSEAWLAAQSALAELDDWRAQASALAGEADDQAVERAATLRADYPPLVELRNAIRAEVERQSGEIARIQALTAPA